ncbi:hypothetical protein EDB86DRAFT_3083735 [Lactarius hatsudake]|nr:hypothetical protein EDB86DRAFT_3083735 [Lactarius hatsudake]
MLRRLLHAEQPSRVDAAPLKNRAHLFDRLRKGRRALRGDPAAPLGDAPVSRIARRTAQPHHARLVCVRVPQAALARQSATWTGNGAPAVPPNSGPGTPGSPRSPVVDGGGSGLGTFGVEVFALLVQALIADDHALMESLIRTQRTQKFAQDSNAALETYQRQVRTLEEQLARSDGAGRPARRGDAVEERAAEQAETLRQLTEANGVLSARALQLAEDAAAAQEELGAVNTVSDSEQTQWLASLEEINLVQTENGSPRQQLRALGKL